MGRLVSEDIAPHHICIMRLFDKERLAAGAPLDSKFVGEYHVSLLRKAKVKFWLDLTISPGRICGWAEQHVWHALHMLENGSFDTYNNGPYADMSKVEFLERIFGQND